MMLTRGTFKMDRILYILVTCTREETRQKALNLCVDSIKNNFSSEIIRNNFIVFDNDSTFQETHELLESTFNHVVKSKVNVGLWSGILYALEQHEEITNKKFDFVFPIESDMFLYDVDKLEECIDVLEKNSAISSIRLKEIDVDNLQKFDKSRGLRQRSETTLKNMITQENAFFRILNNKNTYETNLLPVLPGLHRTTTLTTVLNNLKNKKSFNEMDFWKEYQMICNHSNSATLNMGLFYEVTYEHDILTSVNNVKLAKSIGYLNSRESNIIDVPKV